MIIETKKIKIEIRGEIAKVTVKKLFFNKEYFANVRNYPGDSARKPYCRLYDFIDSDGNVLDSVSFTSSVNRIIKRHELANEFKNYALKLDNWKKPNNPPRKI